MSAKPAAVIKAIEPKPGETEDQVQLRQQLTEALAMMRKMQERQEALEKALLAEQTEKETIKAQTRAEGAGWLITTPNVMYDGITYGVKFSNGAAWVSKRGEYPAGKLPMTPQEEKDLLLYLVDEGEKEGAGKLEKARGVRAEAELNSIEKREKRTSAEVIIELLTTDMGYKSTYYDGSNPEEINQVLDIRAQQAREAEEIMRKAREQGEMLTTRR